LWGCIVGRPGLLKSLAINEALTPLHRLEMKARQCYEAEAAEYEKQRHGWQLRKNAAEKKAKTHAQRAYGAGPEAETAAAKAILTQIRKRSLKDGFTLRDVCRTHLSSLTDREAAQSGLNLLSDLNWVAEDIMAPTRGREPPDTRSTRRRLHERIPKQISAGLPCGGCPTCGKGEFWRWAKFHPQHNSRGWIWWFCAPPPAESGPCDFCGVPVQTSKETQ
jgi:hypothetical protein